ncbi:YciI family protein [Williamsia sterculiae]|uniref:YCII-related domain-containing protein n=1 Tax=Williamsia sterculiae TaxID=1344003 RepID=A0A1N7EDH4_9NOCA|nr:YciI family protein [Williamsia sterculiae]SIR86137.1 hypothetical protein SAMN05445060_1188 [Williamsia sterculiae]
MTLFAVDYTYRTETAGLRDVHRPAHRTWLREQHEAGVVRLSGPFEDQSGALIVIEAEDRTALDAVLAQDPFAVNGAVDGVRVKPWNVVFGSL